MKNVKVEIQQTLTKVLQVDEGDFVEVDTSSIHYKPMREFLLEQLKDEYNQTEIGVYITSGGSLLDETKPDMELVETLGSYRLLEMKEEYEWTCIYCGEEVTQNKSKICNLCTLPEGVE